MTDDCDVLSSTKGARVKPPVDEEMESRIDIFLEAITLFLCEGTDLRMSHSRIEQKLLDRIRQEGSPIGYLLTGSFYEGMYSTVCGDVDTMIIVPDMPHVLHGPPIQGQFPEQNTTNYVLVEGNPQQPAYLRLKLPRHLTSLQQPILCRSVKKFQKSLYLSSSNLANELKEIFPEGQIHGPAITLSGQTLPRDLLFYSCCPSWPPCAEEYLSRPRPHGWPPLSLLNDLEQAGCHVVPVGHSSTERRDLEWRYSFSVAEKELIHKMNTTMVSALYTLKAINIQFKMDDTTSEQPKAICSYYFKVACLWIAEDTDFTDKPSIMSTVRRVLKWMIQCYKEGNLPHYFIRQQNLICHLPQTDRNIIVGKLEGSLSNLWHCINPLDFSDLPYFANLLVVKYIKGALRSEKERRDSSAERVSPLVISKRDNLFLLLEEGIQMLGPSSEMRLNRQHKTESMVTVGHEFLLDALILLSTQKTPSEMKDILGRVFLPVIDNLFSIIEPAHVQTFKPVLFRHLGDIYHLLYAFYEEMAISAGICHEKAVEFYNKGLKLLYPDGWHDKGLSGYVHLARFFYLNGEWDKVDDMMTQIQPLLEDVKNTLSNFLRVSFVIIDLGRDGWTFFRKGDKPLYDKLYLSCNARLVAVHAAVLGWYILGRLSLRQGRMNKAEMSAKSIEWALGWTMKTVDNTAQVFLDVLNKSKEVHANLSKSCKK